MLQIYLCSQERKQFHGKGDIYTSLSAGQWDRSTVYKHPHDGIDTENDSMTAQCPGQQYTCAHATVDQSQQEILMT